MVIMRHPDTGWINYGAYRVQVHGKKIASVMCSKGKHGNIILNNYNELGQKCPIAVVCGMHPALFMVAGLEIPYGKNEYDAAGGLLGEPVEVIIGPVTGLPIPANAEIAFEGYVHPNDLIEEGPLGEWTGYYAGGLKKEPAIRVESFMHRDNPILLGAIPGIPPDDDSFYRGTYRSGAVWNQLEAAGVPEVKGVWSHEAGGSRLWLTVSIKQLYAGHSKQAGLIASQCHAGAYANRFVVVVDDDIDPADMDKVIWAMCTRFDPREGLEMLRGCWSTVLDPMAYSRERPAQRARRDRRLQAVQPARHVPAGGAHEQELEHLIAKVQGHSCRGEPECDDRQNRHHAHHQRPRARDQRRAAQDAGRRHPRRLRPDRHAYRLRARRLRHLHGDPRRRGDPLVPDVRDPGGGQAVRTVEGLADGETLHPLQQAFIDHHGLQCGFCTPGFLMLAANALEQQPDIGDEELLDVLSSNLCRCTGYQNIIKAVKAARDEMKPKEAAQPGHAARPRPPVARSSPSSRGSRVALRCRGSAEKAKMRAKGRAIDGAPDCQGWAVAHGRGGFLYSAVPVAIRTAMKPPPFQYHDPKTACRGRRPARHASTTPSCWPAASR